MAIAGWRSHRSLKSLLATHYGRFNVFQLMRLMLWKSSGQSVSADSAPSRAATRAGPGSGHSRTAWRIGKRLRFSADLSGAFPGHEITGLSVRRPLGETAEQSTQHRAELPNEVIEMTTPNFCIASTLGPLPEPFTEWVRDLKRERETAMEDFFNIFNQRMNVLRFQLKTRQTLALNNLEPGDTAHARYLASLMGMGQPDLAAQIPLPRRAWLGIAGLLSNTRRSAFVVTHVLSEFVGAKVTLEQLVGAWQPIEQNNRMSVGLNNHRLGRQTVLGRRTWDQHARVRITIEALEHSRFCRLLPPNLRERALLPMRDNGPSFTDRNTDTFDAFVTLIRFLLDRQCDCEVRLTRATRHTPPPALTVMTPPRTGPYWGLRLGQTAWLTHTKRPDQDTDGANDDQVRSAGYLVRAFEMVEVL